MEDMTESKAITAHMAEERLSLEETLSATMNELESQLGGRTNLIMALASTQHTAGKKLARAINKRENKDKTIYEIMRSINTSPLDLQEAVSEGALLRATMEAYVEIAKGMPQVLKKSVDVGVNHGPDGYKDRELLLKVGGLVKEGKGVQVNLTQQQVVNTSPATFEDTIKGSAKMAASNPFEDDIVDVEVVNE